MNDDNQNSNQKEIQDILKGRKVLISMFIGEVGWELQRFQAHLRYLKKEAYPDYDFVCMIRPHMHAFYNDFVSYTYNLPQWFNDLNLEADGYEAVLPETSAGGLTPPEVYQNLILLMEDICKEAEEYQVLLPPRGCSMFIEHSPQLFIQYTGKTENIDRLADPTVTVFPRGRARAAQRNIPEYIWKELVIKLSNNVKVVLAGTPSGACLSDFEHPNVINLISYNELDKTEKIITSLNKSIFSISSQSGGTHISVLTGCPSYILGHEMHRHTKAENRLNTPTSFRTLHDYRAVTADEMICDCQQFYNELIKANWYSEVLVNQIIEKAKKFTSNNPNFQRDKEALNRPSLLALKDKKDLVGIEIGVDCGKNALNMLQNLDIKKLYLVDPYVLYDGLKGIGLNNNEEQCVACKAEAYERLKPYEDKIEWIEDTSINAIDKVPDEVDFVYVDGNHRFNYVVQDIQNYYPKVKPGGTISFHDFEYPDVSRAVFANFDKELIQTGICLDSPGHGKSPIRYEGWIQTHVFNQNVVTQDYKKLMNMVKHGK